MSGRKKFQSIKSIINLFVKINSIFPNGLNRLLFLCFRNFPGKLGLLIRYILLRNLSKDCGENVSVHPNVFLLNVDKISFGNNVSIHPMCYIDGAGGIFIGNDVSVAHSTTILSTNHTWININIPIKYNEKTFASVFIGDDVWIGCGCRILAGVKIASRAVLAAGAVLNKDVYSNTLVGGVPAKEIKKI
jgi:acetyltransferase-like isoleucine patch superfamily enzyme